MEVTLEKDQSQEKIDLGLMEEISAVKDKEENQSSFKDEVMVDIHALETTISQEDKSGDCENRLPQNVESTSSNPDESQDSSEDAASVSKKIKTTDTSQKDLIDGESQMIDQSHNGESSKSEETELNNDSRTNFAAENSHQDTTFEKPGSKFRKRNYRNQSNASDIGEPTEDPVRQGPAEAREARAESDSSESVNFERDGEEKSDSDDSEDQSDDQNDSNEWTTASDDDTEELLEVLQKKPSKSEWSIPKDVVNRSIGLNNFAPRRFYGSLHAVQRLELMYKLDIHDGCVNALGFNQSGKLLASASDDLCVAIWDWAIGKKRALLQSGHRSNVFQSKWLPIDPESHIITCARDGQVRLIDVHTGVSRKLAHHRAACHKISTHLDTPHIILSGGEDSKVLSIDVRESKPTKILSVKDNDQEVELNSVHSNPLNSNEFCVAGRMRYVKIYDRRKPTVSVCDLCPQHLLNDDLTQITCAVYNHNGTEIVASYNNEDAYLFDTGVSSQLGDYAHKYQGHRNCATVKGINFFGPSSEFVLSGSDCGNIFIWDKKSEAIVQWMAGDEQGTVNALEPHPSIPILATSGLDYDVKIWIPSREETPNIKEDLKTCVRNNMSARKKFDRDADAAFDGQVLWIMLRHIRQTSRHGVSKTCYLHLVT
ncbi:hypothetical protein QAD02_000105 [Eretmocerus hayati]|uniref:Uncharacterized protein n=1 Tax=Eretmocerus hayati TaxID=131215 RepID=A0ACC2NDV6_9HYME|nr:hypothetical protein QAD02_000105 [Eretmocerus hayati]